LQEWENGKLKQIRSLVEKIKLGQGSSHEACSLAISLATSTHRNITAVLCLVKTFNQITYESSQWLGLNNSITKSLQNLGELSKDGNGDIPLAEETGSVGNDDEKANYQKTLKILKQISFLRGIISVKLRETPLNTLNTQAESSVQVGEQVEEVEGSEFKL
jgi:hypothetical protein